MRRAVVLLALLFAACGGEDRKPRYERDVRAIVADARANPATLSEAADRLRRLEPPEEVAGPHRDLVAAFDAIAEANARDTEPPDDVIDRLLEARRAFGARGYDIGVYGPLS